MSRLRFNNSIGTLGGSLTSTATSVTFASSPGWPTVVAPDIVPLVIDPPGSTPNASFEIVWVTAYTAGTTTATIVRGQESTSPVSHANGAQWMMAPTAGDFPIGLSYTPATAPPPSRAYRNAAYTAVAGAWTKMPLDAIAFDVNGYFDVTTNNRYKVPTSGYYAVNVQMQVASVSTQCYVAIYKNGAPAATAQTSPQGGATEVALSDVVQCSAGDYLELWYFAGSASAISPAGTGPFMAVTPLTQQSIASQITPVVARAYRNAALTVTASTWTKVPVDALSFDTGSNMDVGTNHRFTAPVAGYYQVDASAQNGGTGTIQTGIYKNGTLFTQAGQVAGGGGTFQAIVPAADEVYLNAGDYLELWVYTTNTSISPGSAATYLTVSQIVGVPGANLAAARAYRNAALSVSANNWNKVPLDTKSFDPNGNMDVVTNGRYNVPAAGPYLVCAAVNSPTDRAIAAIYRNGSLVSEGSKSQAGSGDGIGNVVDIVQCNAGDYIELWYYPFGASSLGSVGSAYLNFLSVTPLVSAVASTPGFGSSGSSSAATNVARAYRSASLSWASTAWQKIPLDTVSFDPSALVSITNGRINIGASGYYQVEANAGFNFPGARAEADSIVAIYVNGSPMAASGAGYQMGGTAGIGVTYAVSDVLKLNAGDYVELWGVTDSGLSLLTGSAFWGTTGQVNYLSIAQVQAPSGTGNANALPAGASYQNGVINSTDLAISALSINTSTGALTFTLASAVPVIIKDASGLLIPVTFTGSTFTLIPPTLPTTSNSRVIGVEIDANGQVSLVSGASVAGQQSTASTIETNTASITPGHLRVADIGVYNNAGAYNFSDASTTATQGTNWVDRRPWARRTFSKLGLTGGGATLSNTAYGAGATSVGGTALQARAECSGGPVRVKLHGLISTSSTNNYMAGNPLYDGSTTLPDTGTSLDYWVTWCSPSPGYTEFSWEWIVPAPAVGSHLFGFQVRVAAASIRLNGSASTPLIFTIEELLSTNANNGTV